MRWEITIACDFSVGNTREDIRPLTNCGGQRPSNRRHRPSESGVLARWGHRPSVVKRHWKSDILKKHLQII